MREYYSLEYWCSRCGQHMDPITSEYYCSYECLSDHHVPIFTSLPHALPSIAGLSKEIGLWKARVEATPATSIQMPEITPVSPLRFQNVPHLPIDILLCILDYAQHSDLPALCRVSKTFHDCASNILYCDISAVRPVRIVEVCWTLSRSPGLARKVKHFELAPQGIVGPESDSEYALVGNALRSMTHLRSLKMTVGEEYSEILALCTAQIQSFECSYRCNHNLIRFLHSQSDLTTLKLWCDLEGQHRLSMCLPKLTKLDAPMSWLSALIPGRPVEEVIFHESSRSAIPTFDITYLASSLSPIRTLAVGSPSLFALTLSQITSILPALEKLTITTPHIVGRFFQDSETTSFGKWLQGLISALPALTSITLVSTGRSFSWFDRDALSFVETAVRFASNIEIFTMESPHYSPIRSTWIRVDGKWSLCHRERQGESYQEFRSKAKQRRKERVQRRKERERLKREREQRVRELEARFSYIEDLVQRKSEL